ncbi:MAG: hypothetical protein ABIG96_05545 [Candidatus Micrarchaeota archaeon]
MSFSEVLNHTFEAYKQNFRLISFFSVPFVFVFFLSVFLPNFVSLSGIFLRYGSIQTDLTSWDTFVIVAAFLVSLALFSFALVMVNMSVKAQRTLKKLSHYDNEKIEINVMRMFTIFLAVFVMTLLVNLFLYDYQLTSSLGLFFSLLISLAVIFVPQAIVIDDLSITNAVYMSISVVFRRFTYFLAFLLIASGLVLLNTQLFLEIGNSVPNARYFAVLINALIILPFLEVMKVQIYLSKYTVLRTA